MEEVIRFPIAAILLLIISCAYSQYTSRQLFFTHRRLEERVPNLNHHHGNLFFPVDGRNATLDCWNYDRDPVQCAKISHCRYHCHQGHCRDSNNADPKGCSQFCLDPCSCKIAGCFDSVGVNCMPDPQCTYEVPEPSKKGPPITLRKSNRYPFHLCPDGAKVKRISPKRGDFEYVPVISVNMGGERHVDEMGWIFKGDGDVGFEDPGGMKEKGSLDEVTGVSAHDKPLYSTYVKGKGGDVTEQKKCLTYVASLCEEGNYLLDLKVMEPEYEEAGSRLFDVKINDVVVLDELDILFWTKEKGRVAEILVNFVFSTVDEVLVDGQLGNVTDGVIKISFCPSDCPKVKDRNFVVSAFQVLHWQRSVNVYGTPVRHRGDECTCRILAGKEYNYETTMCTTPRECTPCSVKSTCIRADSVYVSGGSGCRNRLARGSCIIDEIINAVNINGRAHHDTRGIRYVGDTHNMYDDPYSLRYEMDGDISEYGFCPTDPWTGVGVTGVVPADAVIYETFTRSLSSGMEGMCTTYNISETVKKDGKYEFVVKTVEPYYMTMGLRSFSIRIFHDDEEGDKPVIPDLDILRFSEPCEGTDVIVNFEVTDGGKNVLLGGLKPRALTEKRMKVGFCLSSCRANVSVHLQPYDPDFIVSAFYIARFADKNEPHIEAAIGALNNKTSEENALKTTTTTTTTPKPESVHTTTLATETTKPN